MKTRFTKTVLSLSTALLLANGVLNTSALAAQPVHETIVNQNLKASITGLGGARTKYKMDTVHDTVKKTGFTEMNNKTYYLDGNGLKHTGSLTTSNGSYYFDKNGEMQTGFVSHDNSTYYYDENTGELQSGEVTVSGKTYILDEQGRKQSGWVENDDKKYYLNENGEVTTNKIEQIDGTAYSFDASGVMETNVTRGNYQFDETGKGTADQSAYEKIAQAAKDQIGVNQDCTMLVTNSLKAAGIDFHGAPAAYLSLGPLTDNPVPGDIIVYQGHVAIYIGDGQAVHGGWNGYTTAIYSVNCSTPLVGYVHPILP